MYKILVLSHSTFCKGISEATKMILGESQNISFLSLTDEGVEKFTDELQNKIKEIKSECESILILADLFGGTPFNKAIAESIKDNKIKVISGVNLPMVMEAAMNVDSELDLVYKNILNSGIEGIKVTELQSDNDEDDE